ncbi:MAG: hypothetical protein HVN35_03290 [Methanobacteriaceae archaeon]|nr:hypothetical protein [Methanobacteriaceae archaeon]
MEPEDVEITEKDVMDLMDVFTRVPPLVLKMVVARNNNVVKSFESQIKDYFNNLTDEERIKVRKVMDMPVFELQDILRQVYLETGQKQLKILSDPKSHDFIEGNLKELEKLLFL